MTATLLIVAFTHMEDCWDVSRHLRDLGVVQEAGVFEYNNNQYAQCVTHTDNLRPKSRPQLKEESTND